MRSWAAWREKVASANDGPSTDMRGSGSSHLIVSATSRLGQFIASGGDFGVRLWSVARRSAVAVLKAPIRETGIAAVAFSPDGLLIAAGSANARTVRLWDVAKGTELAVLQGHTGAVYTVAFSPDGTLLASGSKDKTVRLWNAAQRTEVATLVGHTDYVFAVAFGTDGEVLASASADTTVRLWDVVQRQEAGVLRGHIDKARTVAFSPRGTRLASGGGTHDGTVRFWDVAQRQQVAVLRHDQLGTVVFGTIHSPALEGNLIGDSATRPYAVYLPPGYEVSAKRYPVLYVLHGYDQDETAPVTSVQDASDRML